MNKDLIRIIADFPKPGIIFKDITPLLADAKALNDCCEKIASYAKDVVDRIGAGDAYLAAASIALESGASLKVSMFFASILAGKVVGEMGTGNSLLKDDLWKTIEALMK